MLRNNKDTKYNVSTLTSKLRKLEVQFEEKVYL